MTNARRIVARQLLCLTALALVAATSGCRSKGKLAGRLTIRTAPELATQGLKLKDWSVSGQNLQLQLEATKDLAPDWLLTAEAETGKTFQTVAPLKMKAGDIQWIEIGGPGLVTTLEVSTGTPTVTVGLRKAAAGR